MAQSGYTPLSLYYSATASTAPLAANLVAGELALNTNDGKLFYKDSSGNVQVLASKAGNVNVSSFSAGTTGLTPSTATTGAVTLAGTLAQANGGTGFGTYTTGDTLYASASNTLSKLAVGTNGQILRVVSGVPAWGTDYVGTVTSVSGTGTVNGLTLTGTVTSSGSLTLGGTLDLSSPPAIGGTSASTGKFTSLTDTGLTSGRVTYATTGGLLTDNAGLTFSSGTNPILTVTSAAAGSPILRSTNGTQEIRLAVSGSNQCYVGTTSNDPLAFLVNGSEQMRIDSSGNLLVGQTTSGLSSTNGYSFSNGNCNIAIAHPSGTPTGYYFMQFGYAGSTIGSIAQSGTAAVLYNVTSDERLKENIVDASSGNIDDVKVRSFNWKSDGSHVEYGFIAQELIEVAPYAVHQPQDAEEMMAVDYSKLVPMMIKEIQDLKQRIKTLESK